MTDLRQAAQQALDAWDDPAGMKDLCVAMDAIRTALEQQAEPVAWMDREGDLYKMPEIENWSPPHTMLYTTPPQRQWQGLTDEEANLLWENTDDRDSWELIKRVEIKLKEKNSD